MIESIGREGRAGHNLRKHDRKRMMGTLYAVYVTFILLTLTSYGSYYFETEAMDDSYDYHLVFKNDGNLTHYYVERSNSSADGIVNLTYITASNTLQVEVTNIKVLQIDCQSLFEDEGMDIFGIDPLDFPNFYKKYFFVTILKL